tara:strand:+ start:1656 stop:1916 length:261 start_codon:yes stop_codon:yes gene_type:complete
MLEKYKNHCVFDCELKKNGVNTLHENIIDFDAHIDIKLSGHVFYGKKNAPVIKKIFEDIIKTVKNKTEKKIKKTKSKKGKSERKKT